MAEAKTRAGITQIGTVIYPISDQEKAIEFYCDTLGFEKRIDVAFGGGYRWVEVAPPGAATTIALAPPPDDEDRTIESQCGFATDDADATHAELEAQGVDVDAEVSRMGDPVPPMFTFRDPEGNEFRVVERD